MAVRTLQEYIESLRKLKPTAYRSGEKIENVVDSPRFRKGGIPLPPNTVKELTTRSESLGLFFLFMK